MGRSKNLVSNIHIGSCKKIYSPHTLKRLLPASKKELVSKTRKDIANIIAGRDKRMLAVVGPCSLHDADTALDYAERLSKLLPKISNSLLIIMRSYFEKPRTRLGWPGMIMDPHFDESNDIEQGLYIARNILKEISNMNIPCGTEFLDPIVPQYIDDFISWASIGARTTESQIHRYMASGLSMPVGFKNGTQGDLAQALNAMTACRSSHGFLGINQKGQTAVLQTKGHSDIHLILRGGNNGPNYSPEHVQETEELLQKASLPNAIVVDCSHGNSGKDIYRQPVVLESVIKQKQGGRQCIIGFMLESNLVEGKQDVHTGSKPIQYGVSITDACIGWETTEALLLETVKRLGTQ